MTFQKKIENYWFYYKWHTIAAVIIIIAVAMGVKSCVDRVEPDISVAYIAQGYVNTQLFDETKSGIEEAVGDVNGDGKKDVFLNAIMFSDSVDPQMEIALNTKATLAIAAGDSRVYIMDKGRCEMYADSGAFESLGQFGYANGLLNTSNELYAVPIEITDKLKKMGFNDNIPLYAAMRVKSQAEEKNKNIDKIMAGARAAFEYIVNN